MEKDCISLIGMPGVGKTTIGKKLASLMDFVFVDSDSLIESIYARRLQDITNELTTEQFRDLECEVIKKIDTHKCVIATGGSVIYRKPAIDHLKTLGPLIYLSAPLEKIITRIRTNPERGISFKPGQSIQDLYEERLPLYKIQSDFICDTSLNSPYECALWIKNKLLIQ